MSSSFGGLHGRVASRFGCALALAVAALLMALSLPPAAGTAYATAGGGRPVPPAGHDVTRPWVMGTFAQQVPAAKAGPVRKAAPVRKGGPGRKTTPVQSPGQVRTLAPRAGASLNREVMGFATAANLGDPAVGYQAWNFSLLSTVAFYGLTVNEADGSLVQNDTGAAVWNSATATNFISAAHAAGVRVLLSVINQDSGPQMCTALNDGQTTINQIAAQLNGADGVNIDYEGVNQTCPDGVSARDKFTKFIQALRARNLGYLVVNTYAGATEDPQGFFDLSSLSPNVNAFFVMAFGFDALNGPCPTCIGPTAPLSGAPTYAWNATRVVNDYTGAGLAAQTILGVPYYGVRGCVAGPNPPPNAQITGNYGADPYTVIAGYPASPTVTGYSAQRDAVDTAGQEPFATFTSSDPQLGCTVEEYWDDGTSLGHTYDLVNSAGLRGAGVFALDFGGSTPQLWNALQTHFTGSTATAPGAPTGVTAAAGDGQATVSWTAPASNGGSAITSYTVTSSPGGVTATAAASAASATVTGLANGTSYTFTVAATNAVGTGPASAPSNAVTPSGTTSAPVLVQATSVQQASVPGGGSVTVTPAANVTAGDRLLVVVGTGNPNLIMTSSVTDDAGNTYTQIVNLLDADFATGQTVWTAPISTGGTRPSITVTMSACSSGCPGSTSAAVTVLEYAGLSTAAGTSAVDQQMTAGGGSSTAGTVESGATAATAGPGELAVGFYTDSAASNGTVTAGPGWTARVNNTPTTALAVAVEDQTVAQGATPDATFVTSAGATWLAAVVVFKTAPAGGGSAAAGGASAAAVVRNGSHAFM